MIEQQWLAKTRNAQHMVHTLGELRYPRTKVGRRKLRLFACGCCRMVWHMLSDERLRAAVEVAEQFADGQVEKATLDRTYERLQREINFADYERVLDRHAVSMAFESCHEAAYVAAYSVTTLSPNPLVPSATPNDDRVLCDLLRCVFGNPFQKPAFPKTWRTETVVALATGVYQKRAFDRLPILADALEEAGCNDRAMLTHLRDPGPHCRGCWVLDLALGKS